MKILLISYFFPPYNSIGAVRTGKLAEYWLSQGHDVRVISADNQLLTSSLPMHFPLSRVRYSRWVNVNALPEVILGGRAKVAKQGFSSGSSLLARLGNIYKTLLNFPDGQIGWYPFAVKTGKQTVEDGWKPDLIYASAHPITSLLIAKRLSSKYDVPWVAEFRDLWTDNPYYKFPAWRKWIERKIESRVLLSASAAVTVSEPLAETLRNKTQIPVATILNGFDPNDYSVTVENIFTEDTLNIVYTGIVYVGKRDPSPLFSALKLMKNADRVRVHFFGRYLHEVERLVEQYKVRKIVSVSEAVPYEQAIQIQMQSDILLLLLWNSKNEHGVYTGKLFEYLGARHPILAIGSEEGVAAQLIKKRDAGVINNDSIEIARQLEKWVENKMSGKKEFILPKEVSAGLTRVEQFAQLDSFLSKNDLLTNPTSGRDG
jgi:glycosyltransferase involved in cell wall biosynthesis